MIIYIRASLIAQFVKIPPKMQKTPIRFLGWEDAGEGTGYPIQYSWASLMTQLVKNLPAMQETWVQSLGWEDPLEKRKTMHSSILAWRFHGMYSPWGHKVSDMTRRLTSLHWWLYSQTVLIKHLLCSVLSDSLLPMDCSLPRSSVHGIFQARILKWVAIPSSRRSSQPRDPTCVSCIGRWILYH